MANVQLDDQRFDPNQRNGNTGIMPPTFAQGGFSQPAGANETGQAGAGTPPPTGGDAYRKWLADQYHTPENILRNYWAPDFKDVFMTPSRWGADAPAQAAPAASAPFDFNAYGQAWQGSGGRTLQDWQNYWNAHPEASQNGAQLTGSKQDKVSYGGHTYDMVIGAGLGGQGASFSDVTNPAPGAMPQSSYAATFDDPSTKRLEEWINQLVSQRQQPPFSGQEAEILRTQALDPIEHDRQAAHQRALQNVGSRGFDPTSGIAQDLFNQVDQGFDTQRAQAQNQLAYNTIGQKRTNEQDVLSLLQLLYQLPRNAMQDSLAVINGAPNYSSLFNGYSQLGAMNSANSANSGQWLGQILAYLLR